MEDYKIRMVEEHAELCGRVSRLEKLLRRWKQGILGFTPTCPRDLLERQLDAMTTYRDILEKRAELEDVALAAPGKGAA